MKTLKYIVMAMALLGLASCVKDVDFDGEQTESMLVVNGLQQVGKPANLCIEKSLFFMDAQYDCRVKDLEVDLYVNGVFKESLQVRDSLVTNVYYDWNWDWNWDDEVEPIEQEYLAYAFNYCEGQYVLCAGDRLYFEVRSSEFATATAEVTMPHIPNVVSFDTVSIDYEGNLAQFALVIDDPLGPDYYNLYPSETMNGFVSSDLGFSDYTDIGVDDFMGESTEYYGFGMVNILRDTYFDGTTHTVLLQKWYWEDWEGAPFILEVSRVDEHLCRYKSSYDAYQQSDPESMLGMFAEPVQVYSNVTNAMGVVCAQSEPVVFVIDLTNE